MIMPGQFVFNCPSVFREEAFWNIFPIGSNVKLIPGVAAILTNFTFFVPIWNSKWRLRLVVYRSSETSTNQSDVIIRSDDRFLNLVVDSDSIVSKIYMLNSLALIIFVVSEKKAFEHFPIGFNVNLCIAVAAILDFPIGIKNSNLHLASVVCRLNFSHFKLLLRNHRANWNQT
jgi:hypothetical protein